VARLDRDVAAAATLLMARYGDGAGPHAYLRAEHLLMAGDVFGHDLWVRVARAIERLQHDENVEVQA
jgi:hypothetical protein